MTTLGQKVQQNIEISRMVIYVMMTIYIPLPSLQAEPGTNPKIIPNDLPPQSLSNSNTTERIVTKQTKNKTVV